MTGKPIIDGWRRFLSKIGSIFALLPRPLKSAPAVGQGHGLSSGWFMSIKALCAALGTPKRLIAPHPMELTIMGQLLRTFLAPMMGLGLWLSLPSHASDQTFVIAVVPQFAPTQIHRDWSPVLAHLEKATGYHFQLRVYDQIPRFESELAQGIPDLALMNPYHMVIAHKTQGYRPLVRDATALAGILVVRRDSPAKTVADLNNKTLAFPSPNALGASLYMRALLTENEGIKFKPSYVGNHQTVYRQVLIGDAAAGGGIRKTLDKEPEGIRAQLRVIYTTPDLAPHPLAAHPRVPAAASKKIVDALLAMPADPEVGKLLAAIQMPQPREADYRRDYEPLSRLSLERYADNQ